MQKFNITIPKKYTSNGEEKTAWNTIGTMIKWPAKDGKPESYSIEIPIFGDTKFFVFEQKPKVKEDNGY